MQLDWNDLKFFLAVAECKNIKRAAEMLQVNHTTIIRRIDALEYKLETKLFIRSKGFVELTDEAQSIQISVRAIKKQIVDLERKIIGKSDKVSGDVVLTLPLFVATHLILPKITEFYDSFPDINLELETTSDFVNLAKREADIAIRLSDDPQRHLETYLFGRKTADIYMSSYTSSDAQNSGKDRGWIAWDDTINFDSWLAKIGDNERVVHSTMKEPLAQLAAVKHGVGDAILPCFIGDQEPALRRKKNSELFVGFEAWVIVHEDLKHAEHIQAVKSFIIDCFDCNKKFTSGS